MSSESISGALTASAAMGPLARWVARLTFKMASAVISAAFCSCNNTDIFLCRILACHFEIRSKSFTWSGLRTISMSHDPSMLHKFACSAASSIPIFLNHASTSHGFQCETVVVAIAAHGQGNLVPAYVIKASSVTAMPTAKCSPCCLWHKRQ